MSIKERVAYLKGLVEGFGLDSASKEGKLFSGIIDALSAIADELDELNENALDIGEELDALSDDLADVEACLFDDDDDDDDFDFVGFDDEDEEDDEDEDDDDDDDDEDEDDDDGCSCGYCGGDDFSLEIECPKCGVETEVTEADLLHGSVTCASCGEVLDIEFDEDEDEEGEESE